MQGKTNHAKQMLLIIVESSYKHAMAIQYPMHKSCCSLCLVSWSIYNLHEQIREICVGVAYLFSRELEIHMNQTTSSTNLCHADVLAASDNLPASTWTRLKRVAFRINSSIASASIPQQCMTSRLSKHPQFLNVETMAAPVSPLHPLNVKSTNWSHETNIEIKSLSTNISLWDRSSFLKPLKFCPKDMSNPGSLSITSQFMRASSSSVEAMDMPMTLSPSPVTRQQLWRRRLHRLDLKLVATAERWSLSRSRGRRRSSTRRSHLQRVMNWSRPSLLPPS